MTKQKQVIIDILKGSHKHLTAQEIFIKAREKMPSIALGTVYRNLKILSDEKLIMPIEIAEQPTRYDGNPIKHDHIICKACGEISDICDLTNTLQNAINLDILSHNCTIYYLCKNCKEKGEFNYES